ncbi:MAG: hypothetical protein U0835_27820, partial [Isosphaeraceae bacterium]
MSETRPAFFDDRDRAFLPREAVDALPFPLAACRARLADGLEQNEPVAAAWSLRDAFEALVKFSAALAVADALQAEPSGPLATKLAGLLLKPQGLSLGDWHTLLHLAVEPLAGSGPGGRALADLAGLMFLPKTGKKTPLNRMIDGDEAAFVAWRNRVFGHGVFRNDLAWYAGEVKLWLPKLRQFYDALSPVLNGWRLVSTEGEAKAVWQGTRDLPPSGRHAHEPSGEPTPMVLVHDDGRSLPFGPMLSVQACARCGQPAAFFFDKNKFDRDRDRHRTTFLEYFGGHDQERKDWPQTRALAACVPPTFVWEREVYDPDEIAEGVRIVFLGFETEYRRPDYLLDAVWEAIESTPKGRYVFIGGPEGVGKTYAVRGLEREAGERDSAVLLYHVLPNESGNYQTFMSSLNDRAKEHLKLRTPDLQARGASTPESLQAEFCDYLQTLRTRNKLDRLVVVLDALDELPEPDPRTPAITDFLPPAAKLPDRCAVVLTSRDPLRPRTRRDVDRLRETGGEAFIPLRVDPSAPPNRELLRAYLLDPEAERLPAGLRTPGHADTVISRAGGAFLYVFHLSRALCSGAFPDLASLPEGPAFYPSYLARLRD